MDTDAKIFIFNLAAWIISLILLGLLLQISDNLYLSHWFVMITISLVYTFIYGSIPLLIWIVILNISFKFWPNTNSNIFLIIAVVIPFILVNYYSDAGNLIQGVRYREFWGQLISIPLILWGLTYYQIKKIKPLYAKL